MLKNVLGFFMFSLTTIKFPYPLPAAHPAILPNSNPLPFFGLLMNSAPGKIPTNSSQKSYVTRVAFAEVVMRTFGGMEGSAVEEEEK